MNLLIAAMCVPFAIAILIGFDLLLAYPLMWAWNYAIPAIFGLKSLNYWQAFSLLVVASLLIKPTSVNNSK